MPDKSPPNTNVGQLLTHLQPGSLAARLVTGYAGADKNGRADALKDVIRARSVEIANGYADADHKQN
jgi:hypothetical protein